MATIVADVGGGAWTVGSTWVGGVAPTAADSVQIPLGTGNITIDAGAVCRGADFTTYTGTATHSAGATLTIGDGTAALSNIALRFASGMTYTLGSATTSAINFISTSATVQTVDFVGKTSGNVTYNAASNGSWQMTGTHNTGTTATVNLTKGTLNVNGQTASWGLFNASNSNTRVLTLGSAAITITGTGTAWDIATTTGLTPSMASSTITFTGATVTMTPGASLAYGTVNMTGSGTHTLNSTGPTFVNFNRTGTASKLDALTINGAKTVTGTLTLAGNSVLNRLMVQSSGLGTAATITNSGATMTWSNVTFMDIALGTAFDASAITGLSGDAGGNSNITFTTPATQTWAGTSGGNWDANAWTSRVPLTQDNVVINAAFTASQTITANMPRLGKDIDWTGATGSPTWDFSGFSLNMYGSLNMTGVSSIAGGNSMTFRGRGTHTITSAGKAFPASVTFSGPSGSYTLQDAFSAGTAGNLSVTNGTFNANGFNVTAVSLVSAGSATRAVTMGSGTWTFTRNAALAVLSLVATGLTFSGASATMVLVTSTAARTFDGGGHTFGTLTYTVAGSTGTLTVTGANTLNTINFSDATNARTLILPAATTTTVTTFNVNGTAGKLMTVNSSSGGSAATLSKASGTVSSDYLSLQDSAATGGATWYAGANSTNVSGNSGWIFTAPPSTGSGNFLNFLRP